MVIVALLLCAALAGITFAGFDITVSPFTYKVVFNTPAMAVMNGEHMYVLDTNSMRILSIEGKIFSGHSRAAVQASQVFIKPSP